MSKYCPDCGCRTSNGICSNCQEELHILVFQNDCIDSLTPEFLEEAEVQKNYLKDMERLDFNRH